MTAITPVLLCGGSGTRLWPLSRQKLPKQFSRLVGESTLYQDALQRLSGPGWRGALVVTAEEYRFLAQEQALTLDVTPATIMVEPSARNTAPAILAAALHVAAEDPEALLLVAPSDHAIPDAAAFAAAVAAGVVRAREGQMVTFGIRPTRPETGYGWLELAVETPDFEPRPLPLLRFIEKPGRESAEEMLSAGRYLWNAGIFLASARTLIDAFARHSPHLMAPVFAALAGAEGGGGLVRLEPRAWATAESVSIDYAVMERAENLCVVPFGAGWSDLGDWDAVWRESSPDHQGVVTAGSVTAIGCSDSLLRCDSAGVELVGIGLADTVVVAMEDAILVAHKSRAQEVKEAVARLKAKGATQVNVAAGITPDRIEAETGSSRHAVRCLQLMPGSDMDVSVGGSRRTWTVLAGTALLCGTDGAFVLRTGECHADAAGWTTRLRSIGDEVLVLVEAISGSRDRYGLAA